MLTKADILLILRELEKTHGFGYSKDPEVGALQAKLSILLEMAVRREQTESAGG